MPQVTRVRVEELEKRETPATFGTPWPDAERLTLSFAPDGTSVGTQTSSLGEYLQSVSGSAQREILLAFQSWAAVANVNLGLVSDAGEAFGTAGAVQGDARFGDIRIGGRRLASDVLAITAPYNLFDHHSGDVLINTGQRFTLGPMPGHYDLFTAMLQEAGHALGIGNSPSPDSVMYEYYRGGRAGLSDGDIAAVRELYGPRIPDRYEGAAGNGTFARATPVVKQPLEAELTSVADVDVYQFMTDPLNRGVRVNLRAAGLSLLTAKVELLDSSGRVVAVGAASDPTSNDVVLNVGSLPAFRSYYVRVSSATPDVFGVGAYSLEVRQSSLLSGTTDLLGGLVADVGNTLLTATNLLSSTLAVSAQAEYHARSRFDSTDDVDCYRIVVPPSLDGQAVTLLTTVWGRNSAALTPWVEVNDAWGRPLDGQALQADATTVTLQVSGLIPGQAYFLRVLSDSKSVGNYQLSADLRAQPFAFDLYEEGTLDAARPEASAPFSLVQTGQVHFVLAADGPPQAQLELIITAADGREAGRFAVQGGRARSLDLFLLAGDYRLTVRNRTPSYSVNFGLAAEVITDPIGPDLADPTGTPEEPDPDPSGGGGGGDQPPPDEPEPTYTTGPTQSSGQTTTTGGMSEPDENSWWY